MADLEFNDIQGILLDGYDVLPASRYFFLKIENPAQAKAWLGETAQAIATAAQFRQKPGPASAVNLALTYPGLAALGLSEGYRLYFSDEFQGGMADTQRARILGDTDDSGPDHWTLGGPKNDEVHILLMVYAGGKDELEGKALDHQRAFTSSGLKVVFQQDGLKRADCKEHFGFRDGISQPVIEGTGQPLNGEVEEIKAGDFILGYENQFSKIPLSPLLPASKDPQNILPAVSPQDPQKDLGRNGSYLVFRVLSQDVLGFWKYFQQESAKRGDPSGKDSINYLAAKSVGRWPSGAPLELSPQGDDGKGKKDYQPRNDFQYNSTDDEGLKCPVGSHIRRANPRDSLHNIGVEDGSERQKSLTMVNRHRILRRGRPYGDYIENPLEAREAPGERGLLFICLNANISRQFEFIQQTWLNNPKFDGLSDGKDPVVGANDGSASSQMVIPHANYRQVLSGMSRFVKTRGGAYFFLPGLRAIKYLSQI